MRLILEGGGKKVATENSQQDMSAGLQGVHWKKYTLAGWVNITDWYQDIYGFCKNYTARYISALIFVSLQVISTGNVYYQM